MNTYPLTNEPAPPLSAKRVALGVCAATLALALNAGAVYGIIQSGTQGERYVAANKPQNKTIVVNLGELPLVNVRGKMKRV
jgi:hypothetical protein